MTWKSTWGVTSRLLPFAEQGPVLQRHQLLDQDERPVERHGRLDDPEPVDLPERGEPAAVRQCQCDDRPDQQVRRLELRLVGGGLVRLRRPRRRAEPQRVLHQHESSVRRDHRRTEPDGVLRRGEDLSAVVPRLPRQRPPRRPDEPVGVPRYGHRSGERRVGAVVGCKFVAGSPGGRALPVVQRELVLRRVHDRLAPEHPVPSRAPPCSTPTCRPRTRTTAGRPSRRSRRGVTTPAALTPCSATGPSSSSKAPIQGTTGGRSGRSAGVRSWEDDGTELGGVDRRRERRRKNSSGVTQLPRFEK